MARQGGLAIGVCISVARNTVCYCACSTGMSIFSVGQSSGQPQAFQSIGRRPAPPERSRPYPPGPGLPQVPTPEPQEWPLYQ